MTPKQLKIRSLLARLDALQGGPVGKEVEELLDQEAELARTTVKNSPTTKAVKKLSEELMKVKRDPRVRNLTEKLDKASKENTEKLITLASEFGQAVASLKEELAQAESRGTELTTTKATELLQKLEELSLRFEVDYHELDNRSALLDSEVQRVWQELSRIYTDMSSTQEDMGVSITVNSSDTTEVRKSVEQVKKDIEKLDREVITRISEIARTVGNNRGGNANRDITIGGNASTLAYYTDINLKAGNNVSITYAPNHTTQKTDVTISATGGGGSVGGIIRSINNVNTSQAVGATAGTDYVYIASAGVNLTLPSASGNENLYTIKNTGNSSVLVSPDGADTIDSDTNLILVTQYTAVDLVSNGTDNWNIT